MHKIEERLEKLEGVQANVPNTHEMVLLGQQLSAPQQLNKPAPSASFSIVDSILYNAQKRKTGLWVLVAIGTVIAILYACLRLGHKLVYIREAGD